MHAVLDMALFFVAVKLIIPVALVLLAGYVLYRAIIRKEHDMTFTSSLPEDRLRDPDDDVDRPR